jgi:hypothetical protein
MEASEAATKLHPEDNGPTNGAMGRNVFVVVIEVPGICIIICALFDSPWVVESIDTGGALEAFTLLVI